MNLKSLTLPDRFNNLDDNSLHKLDHPANSRARSARLVRIFQRDEITPILSPVYVSVRLFGVLRMSNKAGLPDALSEVVLFLIERALSELRRARFEGRREWVTIPLSIDREDFEIDIVGQFFVDGTNAVVIGLNGEFGEQSRAS